MDKDQVRQRIIKSFEDEISKIATLKKFDGWYIINGDVDSFRKMKRIIAFLPYCFKPVKCRFRLESRCDFSQRFCNTCIVVDINEILDRIDSVTYYYANEDDDISQILDEYVDTHGEPEGVITITCPLTMLKNKRYIEEYNIPVLFFMLGGWLEHEYRRGEGIDDIKTYVNIETIKDVLSKCFGNSPSSLQRARQDLRMDL